MHKAFTLIEVMISVVIISIVIIALLQMNGNNSFIFSNLLKNSSANQYASFFISNQDYGFEDKKVNMDDLVSDFKVEDELRKKLKDVKIEILYQELEKIDLSSTPTTDDEESDEQEPIDENKIADSSVFFEIGNTVLKIKEPNTKDIITTSLIRLRIK